MFEGHRKRAEKVRGYFSQKRAITLFAILGAILKKWTTKRRGGIIE